MDAHHMNEKLSRRSVLLAGAAAAATAGSLPATAEVAAVKADGRAIGDEVDQEGFLPGQRSHSL